MGLWRSVDRKEDRLKDELLAALGRDTRVELLAAQGLNDERLEALEKACGRWRRGEAGGNRSRVVSA